MNKKYKIVVASLSILLIVAIFMCGYLFNLVDLQHNNADELVEKHFEVVDENGNGFDSENVYELPSNLVFDLPNFSVEESVYNVSTGVNVTATVLPTYATNRNLDWSLEWTNPNSDWANGKNVNDYVVLSAVGNNVQNVKVANRFAEQVKLTVRSQDNAEFSASCYIDIYRDITDIRLLLCDIQNNVLQTFNFFVLEDTTTDYKIPENVSVMVAENSIKSGSRLRKFNTEIDFCIGTKDRRDDYTNSSVKIEGGLYRTAWCLNFDGMDLVDGYDLLSVGVSDAYDNYDCTNLIGGYQFSIIDYISNVFNMENYMQLVEYLDYNDVIYCPRYPFFEFSIVAGLNNSKKFVCLLDYQIDLENTYFGVNGLNLSNNTAVFE